MSKEVISSNNFVPVDVQEKLFVQGNLADLSANERLIYYAKLCESLGLNPMTRPFEYITLNGKMTLYARKDATEQLRKNNKISIEDIEEKVINDILRIKVKMKDASGRTDVATGAVNISGLKGDLLANAYMKAETKAKRRGTLSLCGLGFLDETELETIPELKKSGAKNAQGPNLLPKTEKDETDETEIKLDDWIESINMCSHVEMLKDVFLQAKKSVKLSGKKEDLDKLIEAKDKKKLELEKNI